MDPDKYAFTTNIISIFKSSSYLSLATIDPIDGVWINTLNFGYDKTPDLYYMSKISSRHSLNIIKNNKISASIFSTSQHPYKYVKGLQITGKVKMLEDDQLDLAASIYYGRNNIFYDPKMIMDKHSKDSVWKFYVIKINEIFIYDTEFLGDSRIQVPKQYMRLP